MKNSKWLVSIIISFMLIYVPLWAGPVPDTGQTKCYNNTDEIPCPIEGQDFYGQDANYNINSRSYTKLGENGIELSDAAAEWIMVRDNVTGLIWEVKTNRDGMENYSDPHDADNTYTWYDPTDFHDPGTPGDGTDTKDFIDSLNEAQFGGYNDWRLPTIEELIKIIDISVPEPGPVINSAFFPMTAASYYWSSTDQQNSQDEAWCIDFGNGHFDHNFKSNFNYIRAVR